MKLFNMEWSVVEIILVVLFFPISLVYVIGKLCNT